jgi:hypothetical protein
MRWWVWLLFAWLLLSVPAAVLLGSLIRTGQGDDPCATCAHGRAAHEHYRAGSDCALCDCPQYVRPRRQPRAVRVPAAAFRRVLPVPRRSPG